MMEVESAVSDRRLHNQRLKSRRGNRKRRTRSRRSEAQIVRAEGLLLLGELHGGGCRRR